MSKSKVHESTLSNNLQHKYYNIVPEKDKYSMSIRTTSMESLKHKWKIRRSKSSVKSKATVKASAKLSIDWYPVTSTKVPSDSKKETIKSASIPSSLERLSFFFKAGSDKVALPQDNYGKCIKTSPSKSSKSGVESLTWDMHWATKTDKRSLIRFCTGSKYLGEWNAFGMTGEGIYKYPHGVIYDGTFNMNGLFHGLGTIIYPNGQRLQGIWDNGNLAANIMYPLKLSSKPDEYGKPLSDRRYPIEYIKGFRAAGEEYLTSQQPSPSLAEGCYDVAAGLFCPEDGYIITYPPGRRGIRNSYMKNGSNYKPYQRLNSDNILEDNANADVLAFFNPGSEENITVRGQRIREIPTIEKANWIKKYCRSNPDRPVGYRPTLYEVFTTGTKQELDDIELAGDAIKSYYLEEIPTFSRNSEEHQTKLSSNFIQRVNKDKRKKTLEASVPYYKSKKKSGTLRKNAHPGRKYSESPSTKQSDRDLLWYFTPLGTLKRRSAISVLSKQSHREKKIAHHADNVSIYSMDEKSIATVDSKVASDCSDSTIIILEPDSEIPSRKSTIVNVAEDKLYIKRNDVTYNDKKRHTATVRKSDEATFDTSNDGVEKTTPDDSCINLDRNHVDSQQAVKHLFNNKRLNEKIKYNRQQPASVAKYRLKNRHLTTEQSAGSN